MKRSAVRFRLTLWYLTALSLGILAFGALVWFETRQQLLQNREEALDRRLGALGEFLGFEARTNDWAAILQEAREYSAGLPPGHGLRLLDLSGRAVFEKSPGTDHVLTRRRLMSARGIQFQAELSMPLDDFHRTLATLRWVLILPLPFVLVLAGGMGWWLAGRALQPVDAMTQQARAIQARDLSRRISVPKTGDELQRLAESWNELLGRIETAMNAVTRFTADAAHELRTPLAVIRTTSELALRHQRSAVQYREYLQCVLRETELMSGLVERLLLLAREDAGQWQFDFDAIRTGDILRALQDPLAAAAQQKQITVLWSLPPEEPLVWADAEAVRRLVLILADNALKFTPAGGSVGIRLSPAGGAATIEVEDDGVGIEPRHLPHIFERFYRADSARTAGSGAGHGLAIARTITDAHQAQIDVSSTPGKGTLVCVRFPVMSADRTPTPSAARA